jgi:hypothetical protein
LSYSPNGVTIAVFGDTDESYSVLGIKDIAELKIGGGRSTAAPKSRESVDRFFAGTGA